MILGRWKACSHLPLKPWVSDVIAMRSLDGVQPGEV